MAGFKIGTSKVGSADAVGVNDAPAAVALDADGDGWWSGAQRSVVGIVAAGALAALSASSAFCLGLGANDDIVPQVQAAAGTVSAVPAPPQQIVTFKRWEFTDELPVAAANPAFDDDGWAPTIAQAPPVIQTWAAQDEIEAAVVVEHEYWQPGLVRPEKPLLSIWEDGDSVPAAATFGPTDDLWLPLQPAIPAPTSILWATDDDAPVAPTFTPSDDAWMPLVLPAAAYTPVWTDTDELPSISGIFEDYWIAPPPWLATVSILQQVDQDFAPPPFALAEEGWQAAPPWPPLAPPIAQVDPDFAPPAFALTEETWRQPEQPAPLPATVSILPQIDPDFAPPVFALGEDGWQQPAPQVPSPTVSNWSGNDDLPVAPSAFTAEEEFWQPPFAVRVPPVVPVPWADGDDCRLLAATPPTEEDWQPLPAARNAPALTPGWADDDLPTAVTIALDGEAWQAPLWITPSIQIAGPNWDDQALAWIRDEDYWQAPAAAASVSIPALQQDSGEFVPVVIGDDYWQAPLQAAASNVTTLWVVDDDRPTPIPVRDEDYCIDLRPHFATLYGVVFMAEDEVPSTPNAVGSLLRTYVITAQDRVWFVDAQSRVRVIDPETRGYKS